MKTKKLYLFAAVFLFLSVFFVGVDEVRAMDCYELCSGETDVQTCFDDCAIGNDGVTSWDSSGAATDFYGTDTVTEPLYSCDYSYPGSIDVGGGNCDCPYDFEWNATGNACVFSGTDMGPGNSSSCYNNFETAECCATNGGYYYDSKCNTSPASNGKSGNACSSGDSWYSSDTCANGYTCNTDSGVCEVSGWGNFIGVDNAATQAQTPAQAAADKAAQNAAQTKALAATSVQNAATKIVNDKTVVMQQACSTGATQSEACIAAQKARDDAIKAYEKATEDAQAAIAEMDALSGTNYGSQSYGSTGNSIGGVSYGVNVGFGNVPGVSAGSAADCGEGFAKMGGVCFPTNTGLSNASVSSILSNLFLWLMGLFVTFAVVAFVVSGIQYLLAAGDEGMAETAKKNATNAIIGIIVGLSGFIIFKAIAAALSGQSYLF
ncbi:MAG: pilin [Candidatus Moranbacteria bacterium]|nr:pilin [Candidatus Moranbacteria bacterium]